MGFLWMWMLLLNWSTRSLRRSRKRTRNGGNIVIITDGGTMMMKSGDVNIGITEGMKSESGESGHTVHIREESGMLIKKDGLTGGARRNGQNGMVRTTFEGGSQIMEQTGTEALGTITENGETATGENEVHTIEKKAGNGMKEVDQDNLIRLSQTWMESGIPFIINSAYIYAILFQYYIVPSTTRYPQIVPIIIIDTNTQ